ncbi:glycosyltransferase-like domain-containing protein 1 isoform X2 [Ixodes scapularis]|uniref:glycosyltransferase-like domain-containing protein 1 isoform X2 n=1 Tax=Ixodes scapularis TaxID=6945 RepID=UPI001C387C88|nr:glycosyltransferase-like domain-containing protein 1 isoform X2 [Ixodes scapularis]
MSILMMEPFYGGSHKQLADLLASELKDECTLVTMPACKWHWRARTSAIWLAQNVPPSDSYRVLFASSVVPLAELLGLCPWLQTLHKVVYFHENQLAYPVRNPRVRDFQYGYNQILSCLVADRVVFNSRHNLESFLGAVGPFLRQMPDCRPPPGTLSQRIRAKASVLYFPLNLPAPRALAPEFPDILHIVWPHRCTTRARRSSLKPCSSSRQRGSPSECPFWERATRMFQRCSRGPGPSWRSTSCSGAGWTAGRPTWACWPRHTWPSPQPGTSSLEWPCWRPPSWAASRCAPTGWSTQRSSRVSVRRRVRALRARAPSLCISRNSRAFRQGSASTTPPTSS